MDQLPSRSPGAEAPSKRSSDQIQATDDLNPHGPKRARLNVHSSTQPIQKCFRLLGIPSEWTEQDVYFRLRFNTFATENRQLSLHPAANSPDHQVGLLKLQGELEDFPAIATDEDKILYSLNDVVVTLDSHFYGLTPLNNVPDEHHAEYICPV